MEDTDTVTTLCLERLALQDGRSRLVSGADRTLVECGGPEALAICIARRGAPVTAVARALTAPVSERRSSDRVLAALARVLHADPLG
jgi:hypothetical protein